MITTIIIITGLVLALLSLKGKDLTIPDPEHKGYTVPNYTAVFVAAGIFIAGLVVALVQPYNIERVDAGYKGIKVNLTGSDRGVSDYKYETGWVMYNSWTSQVLEFPIYQQHIEYDVQQVIAKGGFPVDIKPTFNYSLKSDAIGDMFTNLRLDVKTIEQGWLKTAIASSVNDIANTWEVDSIFNHRQAFEANIIVECNKRVAKWFTVSQLRTNITPPESLREAIESKTRSIQQAQAEDQRAKTAESTARKKIAEAKGDSAQVVIEASATAAAMRIKQLQLTPLYVEYLKIQKWNGETPTTVLGGTSTMVNIK